MPSLRSQHSVLFAIIGVLIFTFFFSFYYKSSGRRLPSNPFSASGWSGTASSNWIFDPARDSRKYGLSDAQCSEAFPQLWRELERSAKYRETVGKVKPEDAGIGWGKLGTVRAMIYDNQLYILETRGCTRQDFRERSNAILHSIHRAVIASPDPLPNVEFSFNIEDNPNDGLEPVGTTWTLTRRTGMDQVWLMPDFGYWSWANEVVSSYERVRQKIEEVEPSFKNKTWKAVWRGAALNDQRKQLLEVAAGKPWSDVQSIDWGDNNSHMLPIYDHCRYMFVIHTEGRSYSGRLKYIQNCRSVVIIPELEWVEYFHHLLISDGPQQNYVKVKADFSDLAEKMEYYIKRPKEAERIANNNVNTFRQRYLTPAAQACYWRKLFQTWSVHSFEPEFYRKDKEKIWRGIPFETYILKDPVDISLE